MEETSEDLENQTYIYYNFNYSMYCKNYSLVECHIGPIRDPLTTVIPMTLVYSIILMTGVLGNILTCIVIAHNRYMHTATNYYLFSLAVSDLLLLVLGLPQEIYMLWYRYPYFFGESFCILRGLSSEMCTNASVLTITAFTVERYYAICHPFRAQVMSSLPRVVKTIVCIWFGAAVCALPTALQLGISYHEYPEGGDILESASCSVVSPIPHIFEFSTGMFYALPLLIISVLYVLIGLRLRRASIGSHPDSINDGNHVSKQKMNSRKAVVKMLVAVVILFALCWSPFHAQRLMAIYVEVTQIPITVPLENIFNTLTYVSGITYYLSATINPILYQLLSVKFRQALKDTFTCSGGQTDSEREMTSLHCDNRNRIAVKKVSSVSYVGEDPRPNDVCDDPLLKEV
ncbi:hypothetical protein JTE90_007844 [Oedothorax gibbosus]|uniref:G-protein coupled receptors family 1 profile domain-containing protein n=1 Tax=Oedothorax gibbosus TaxID=931172 RepID=A0AAV6VJ14_9ARAC|nr:hypothetical protein JTE90_007844 [Oedothorax gibbosus]